MKRQRLFQKFTALAASLVLLGLPAPAIQAQNLTQAGFESYLQRVAARARQEGVSESAISRTLSGLTISQRVLELDTGPTSPRSSGFPPMSSYINRHVDAARISGGRTTYRQVQGLLPAIERKYGVPGEVLVAIWGHETNYGRFTGSFNTARSVATLAYEGRRRDLFEGELIALMKMIDMGVPTSQLVGSWAGAIGNPQFLPSVWLTTAVDGDGDGNRDIWNSSADTLASIANYFHLAGWRPGQPWGVRVSVPAGLNLSAYGTDLNSPSCARVHERHSVWKPVSEWREIGIRPLKPIGENVMASLFRPDGPGTPAWLITGNYRTILQYNCSNYYAVSVGLLADEIAR